AVTRDVVTNQIGLDGRVDDLLCTERGQVSRHGMQRSGRLVVVFDDHGNDWLRGGSLDIGAGMHVAFHEVVFAPPLREPLLCGSVWDGATRKSKRRDQGLSFDGVMANDVPTAVRSTTVYLNGKGHRDR